MYVLHDQHVRLKPVVVATLMNAILDLKGQCGTPRFSCYNLYSCGTLTLSETDIQLQNCTAISVHACKHRIDFGSR